MYIKFLKACIRTYLIFVFIVDFAIFYKNQKHSGNIGDLYMKYTIIILHIYNFPYEKFQDI